MLRHSTAAKKGLNIIIVGCGKVGATLTEQLSKEGHNLTLIDRNPERVHALADMYDIMGIVGNGASYSVLMEAGIENTDLLISVTESDELNLLCCTFAKRVADCSAIARVRNPDYSTEIGYLREKLGLAMIINPELEAALEIARVLSLPTALEINTFAHGHAEMVKIKIPDGNIMHQKSIAELKKRISVNFLICAIERQGEVYIPSGDFVLQTGDILSFIASRMNCRLFLKEIGIPTQQVKNTIIVGGGKSSFYLAKQLLAAGIDVNIIEQDKEKCEFLSELLPNATIINGDGSDEDLLNEIDLASADSFVPLTGIDEENIILTLHAQQISNAKVITKINRINFKHVVNNLELGSVVYPKYIATEAIIAYVRAKKASMNSDIETLYHLFDSRAEAIEFRIDKPSEITDITLADIKLKNNLLIATINRRGRVFIPSGSDSIQLGDTVIVVAKHTGFNCIENILA